MGITIVQKYNGGKHSKMALILAGGAVSGGSFMVGGIKALNDYFVDFSVNDFDIYVGISAGSLISAPLASGISPESLLRTLNGRSSHFTSLKPWHYYRPNFEEFLTRPLSFMLNFGLGVSEKILSLLSDRKNKVGISRKIIAFLKNPSVERYYDMIGPITDSIGNMSFAPLLKLFPSGLFDNSSIEEYFRMNIERNNLTNDFNKAYRLTKKKLYVCAMALDGANRVVFGYDEKNDISISQAIQASTAMPGFYKPAHIDGVDYVDGGVQESANVDVAVEKGANLIVCYNPLRPYDATEFVDRIRFRGKEGRRMSERGFLSVVNQIFRAVYHSRLKVALDKFSMDKSFKGDIILIEPTSADADFFMLNPFSLSASGRASELGYRSVCGSIDRCYDRIKNVMKLHGLKLSRSKVSRLMKKLHRQKSDESIQHLLEDK